MLRLCLLAGLLLAFSFAAQAVGERGAERYSWPVVAVKDGDTIAVEIPGLPATLNPVAIRLRGVDTPESGGRARCATERNLARRATGFTKRAVAHARRIEFAMPDWDKYGGRIDAEVWIDGVSLADQLIAAGLARAYDGDKRGGWC
ncbi:MAG TPA: thermonuclease family protein [Dongiaceae bacterium]|nr:thermonuclease family protein [Dongiaceae bacterium]